MLVENGADPNATEREIRNTPLHLIAVAGDNVDFIDIAKLLIKHGANVRKFNSAMIQEISNILQMV